MIDIINCDIFDTQKLEFDGKTFTYDGKSFTYDNNIDFPRIRCHFNPEILVTYTKPNELPCSFRSFDLKLDTYESINIFEKIVFPLKMFILKNNLKYTTQHNLPITEKISFRIYDDGDTSCHITYINKYGWYDSGILKKRATTLKVQNMIFCICWDTNNDIFFVISSMIIINKNPIIMLIKCPICKTSNNVHDDKKSIKGYDTKCCICLENNAEVLFDECSHVNCCKQCVISMYKRNMYKKRVNIHSFM